MPYQIQTRKTDALSATMAAGATSCTLAGGNFGSPPGQQILTVDGRIPAKAADFLCTISGNSVTGMTLLNGPDVQHEANAEVSMNMVDEHYEALVTGAGWSTSAIKLAHVSTSGPQTLTGTLTDLAGLSATVTVPSGGRSVKLSFCGSFQQNADPNSFVAVSILKDGTALKTRTFHVSGTGIALGFTLLAEDDAPTAGSHTYKVQASYSGGGAAPASQSGNDLFVELA